MTDYWFYHLEVSPLESVLPDLLEKTQKRGWRTLVCTDERQIGELDNFLWTYKDDSFLPHGRDDEPQADLQPIVLSYTATSSAGFGCVFCLHSQNIDMSAETERCIIMIDGRNPESVSAARAKWKALKDTNATLSYWQQNDHGKWEKRG